MYLSKVPSGAVAYFNCSFDVSCSLDFNIFESINITQNYLFEWYDIDIEFFNFFTIRDVDFNSKNYINFTNFVSDLAFSDYYWSINGIKDNSLVPVPEYIHLIKFDKFIHISAVFKRGKYFDLLSFAYRSIIHRKKKQYNIKQKMNYLLTNSEYTYFLTITFNNESLELQPLTLRNFITRHLTKLNTIYIGNIDYGKTNDRMHYHFCIGSNIPLDVVRYANYDNGKFTGIRYKYEPLSKYGLCDIETIYSKNDYRLTNYVNKLTNHSIKTTTKKTRLLYSRNFVSSDIV